MERASQLYRTAVSNFRNAAERAHRTPGGIAMLVRGCYWDNVSLIPDLLGVWETFLVPRVNWRNFATRVVR